MNRPIYSKYSTEREKHFRIRTDIVVDESGKKFVKKSPYSPSAQNHIDSIYSKYELLDKLLKDTDFSVNKCEKNGDNLVFEYLTGKTLEQQLNEYVRIKDYQAIAETLKEFINSYKAAFKISDFKETDQFRKVFGSVSFPCIMEAIQPCNIDCITGNVFMQDGKWTFIDYEWTFDFPVPFLYVVYRMIFYYLHLNTDKNLNEIGLMRLFGISEELEKCFDKMEHNFQKYVYGSMWNEIIAYPQMLMPSFDINNLLTSAKAFDQSHQIRVFYDYGDGYTGEHYEYISPDAFVEKEYFYSFSIPVKGAKGVRIDPYEESCVISDIKLTEGVSQLKTTDFSTNGYCHDDNIHIFAHYDPIIFLNDVSPQSEFVKFSCRMGTIETDIAKELVTSLEELRTLTEDLENKTASYNQHISNFEKELADKTQFYNQTTKAQNEYISNLERELADKTQFYNQTTNTQSEHISNLEKELQTLTEQLKEKTLHEESMWKDIVHLQNKVRDTENQFNTIQSAFFWKITYPLRKAVDLLKWCFRKFKSLIKKAISLKFVKSVLKLFDKILQLVLGKVYPKTLGKLKAKIKHKIFKDSIEATPVSEKKENSWIGEKPVPPEKTPLVSIIVPNYNHAPYLRKRLDSIYAQTYTNYEVILLDDCSTDNSREILTEYAQKHPENTTTCFNETNAGFVFKQWNKGIDLAKGEYIWIAESDDYCSENFLEELVKQFDYQSVMLAFVPSLFMQDGNQIWSTQEYLHDLPKFDWSKPFIMSAHNAVNKGFAIKNIIPNVSSMMFRNIGKIPQEVSEIWQNIRLCGDWIFYLSIIKGGTISYTNKATNYYRIHQGSTSLKIQETMDYYKEQMIVSEFVAKNYNINPNCFEKVKNNLIEHYKTTQNVSDGSPVLEHYNTDKIKEISNQRKINIAMCCFAMKIGGGETYPLYLANELKDLGYPVTLLNFDMEPYDPEVRKLLNPGVPLVNISELSLTHALLTRLGADIAHSHHGSVDNILSLWLRKTGTAKHVITLHGMYETIDAANLHNLLNDVDRSCSHFIYIADKNLVPFEKDDRFPDTLFTKIGNGLPQSEINPIPRAELGIEENAFVLCIVSRGIVEKGWAEAVEAVKIANKKSKRKIHLVIVGDGEAREKLIGKVPEYVHLVGRKNNTRDYFAMADMGFLPTRFKGESYPLVVIDSLFCGKPVISTSIAEVENQLADENGEKAGITFKLDNWKVPVKEVADIILKVANSPKLYEELKNRVPSAAKKFDIKNIIKEYLDVYKNL